MARSASIGALSGSKVVVLGAGLAGLAAARDLEAEVRQSSSSKPGTGSAAVHTLRTVPEAACGGRRGPDQSTQSHVLELGRPGSDPSQILRAGASRSRQSGPPPVHRARHSAKLRRLAREIDDYKLADERWDSAVARSIARRSVATWLQSEHADLRLEAGLRALRGFFLADPEDLSLLALVDQLASTAESDTKSAPAGDRVFRLPDGNDSLPRGIANRLHAPVKLRHVVRRVTRTERKSR
jgi:monoamine oxidase